MLNNLKYVFDEKFKVCEDTELGVRLQQKGYKILHSQNIIGYHAHRTDFASFSKQQFISGKYAYSLKQKYRKYPEYLPKDLQNFFFMGGSFFIMPFVHAFKVSKTKGFSAAIRLLPFIFLQKFFRYFGLFFGKIYFDNKKQVDFSE